MLENKRKNVNEKDHCVYRYVENGSSKVLYVGKTNSSLRARICAHRYEEQFQLQNPFRVEYIPLENEVETDSVEKFFINKWKPPLNIKDNVSGLAKVISTEMENLKWRSYECYESERRSAPVIKKQVSIANMNSLFLYYIVLANQSSFSFPYLISDVSFLNGDCVEKELIDKSVEPCFGGYRYTLKAGAKEYIQDHFYEIEQCIWSPVLTICKMTDDEELRYSVIIQQLDFCSEIDAFAKDGFENENSVYRYNFRTEYPGADTYFPFVALFDGSPYTSIKDRAFSGDISSFSYEMEMPRIKQEIAANFMDFVYGLETPVVSQELLMCSKLLKQDSYER